MQVTEMLCDLPCFEFLIASGYYTHALQRFRYILESWAYSYYIDIIFPDESFDEKWKKSEILSEKQWRGFLKKMPKNHNLRGLAKDLQQELNKYSP